MSQRISAYSRAGIELDAVFDDAFCPPGFSIRKTAGEPYSGALLDTFSGHLRGSGALLVQLPDKAVLLNLVSGERLEQNCSAGWMFAERLHGGVIGFQLAEMTSLRAFSPVCHVKVKQAQLTLLNELEKTVLRGQVTEVSHDEQPAVWISLRPLRGYDDERDLFVDLLMESGFASYDAHNDYYALIGLDTVRYESKPDIVFEWSTPVYASATQIAQAFLDVARRNEKGLLADLDTEFLHDFRVSLRRTRSMLSLFNQVYAEADCRRVNKELAEIMKRTNSVRDLDVYLMQRPSFFKLVPESMYPGLETLFDIFKQERQAAFDELSTYLQSDDYLLHMHHLQQYFSAEGTLTPGDRAQEASGPYARHIILKRYRKVARIARSINAETPDEVVHMLRIQCKKLRYLMEFFAPLFAQQSMKKLVKSLKGLQELLGTFNDCSVQRESLTEFVGEHPLRGKRGMMLAESVGALVATLYQKQLRVRSEIDAALLDFANKETIQAFKQLFTEGGDH